MNDKYILNADGQPELCDDLLKWATWFENIDNSRLARDDVPDGEVSTVFLGLDHHLGRREHVPILWETVVFGGTADRFTLRYGSRSEAIAGHAFIVDRLRSKLPLQKPDAGE
jgi:hypothetical protein